MATTGKGFWNYTEPIFFRVLNVCLQPVADPVTHWQNCYAGQMRQVIEIHAREEVFFIDNEDGSGIRKIEREGGPDSFHRSVELTSVDGAEVVDYYQWNKYDQTKRFEIEVETDAWMAANYPERFKKLQALKEAGAALHFANRWPTCSDKTVNLGAVPCSNPDAKPLSKKKIKKNAQKERRGKK